MAMETGCNRRARHVGGPAVMVVLAATAVRCAFGTELVPTNASGWRYVGGTQEASSPERTAWRTNGFDHAAWSTGSAPLRYGMGTGGTVLSDMQNTYSCVFMRKEFSVADVSQITALQLKVMVDDGFIAWINGERVAEDNEPNDVVCNALADDDGAGEAFETFTVNDAPGEVLVNGVNVLAIQAWNRTVDSTNFFIDAALLTAVADTRFSVDRGFYDAPFWMTISTITPGATIRWTTNGSPPAASSGNIGGTNTAVQITTTTCLRAAAFKNNEEPTDVDTQTYIFVEDVIDQTGPDPESDDMDPMIVTNPLYAADITNDLKVVPTLSIVGEYAEIMDSSLTNLAARFPEGYEVAVSAELIHPDGKAGFQIDCGIGPGGMSDHMGWTRNKQQFNLFFRAEYGASKLRYKVFDDLDIDRFDGLRCRGAGNDRWSGSWMSAEYGVTCQFVRDEFGRRTQADAGHIASHGRWMHLYINGNYWGMYNVVHKPNESFMAAFYGGEKEDYDVIKQNEQVVGGTVDVWNQMENFAKANSLASSANYEQMRQWLDVTQFMDYHIIEIWGGNGDWVYSATSDNNWRAGRKTRNRKPGDPQFTMFVWDYEVTMEMYASIGVHSNIAGTVGIRGIHDELKDNVEYKREFGDRVHRFFFNDGILTAGACSNRYVRACDEVDRAIVPESARWGDIISAYRDDPRTRDTWLDYKNYLLTNWFPQRSAIVLSQFKAQGLYPEVEAPGFSQHGGEVVSGFQLRITAPADTIYYTTDGNDPRLEGGGIAGSATGGASPQTVTLSRTTHVKARVRRTATSWSAVNEATFTVAFAANGMRVTELMYNPLDNDPLEPTWTGDDFEFIELKNVGTEPIDLSGFFFEGIDYTFAGGTVVPTNGFVVLARNPDAFTNRYPTVTPDGQFGGGLSNGGEKIRLKSADSNTVVSVAYEDSELNVSEDDLGFWPLAADGLGYSLVNLNPAGDPDNPENWRASKLEGGSPGADDPAPDYALGVVISEVLPHTDTELGDAIELYNSTPSPIDISGWYLSDAFDSGNPGAGYNLKKYQIPASTTIPGYGYAVYDQTNHFGVGTNAFGLSEYEDEVYLASAAGGELNGYVIGLRFSASDNGVSFGRHQTSVGLDVAVMSNVTAGAANSAPKVGPVVISEIMYNPAETGSPLTNEFVELYNMAATNADISGWSLAGAGYGFPTTTVIQAQNFLVLVDTNAGYSAADFRTDQSIDPSVPVLGHDFDLANDGETLRLEKPNTEIGQPAILIEKVCYNDKSPWPTEADGEGPSLERYVAGDYGNDPVNWRAANNGGTPGRTNTFASGLAVVEGSSWAYHAIGSDLGTNWRQRAYNDAGWPRGDAALGYGTDPVALALTTIVPYGPDSNDKYITTYFRKEFSLSDNPGEIDSLALVCRYDDGFVGYLNGTEVTRKNMPEGTIGYLTNAAANHSGGTSDWESVDLLAYKDVLVEGNNLLAVEVHQELPTSSDIVWDGKLTYTLSSLPTVDTPTLHPDGATFTDPIWVTLSNTTSGADIYYRLDSGTPTTSDTLYTGPFELTSSKTVSARGFKTGYNPSSVASASFTYDPREVRFCAETSGAGESDGTALIGVELSSSSTNTLTVDYAVSGGTASNGVDFSLEPGTLTFAPGETVRNVTLTILDDVQEEDNETVAFTLSNPGPAGLIVGNPGTHTCTLADNDVLFIAYNDLSWMPGQPNANITTFAPYDTTNGWSSSGELVNYADGQGVGVTLTLAGGAYSTAYTNQGASADPDTEADAIFDFGTILDGFGLVSGGDITFTFAGMETTKRYELVLFGNRANPAYTDYTSDFILAGCAGFSNSSSAGTTVKQTYVPDDTTECGVGWNTVNGHVIRFENIDPGTDGEVSVTMTTVTSGRYCNALRLKAVPAPSTQTRNVKISRGAEWTYGKGTAEASSPANAWRLVAFDDGAWPAGAAPVGYGRTNIVTQLADMDGTYSSVFLRRSFVLDSPADVSQVQLSVDYDDGFLMWLNGEEVARVNMAGAAGEFVACDGTAVSNMSATWAATLSGTALPALAPTNVAALQLFNCQLTGSGDALIDAELAVLEGSRLPPAEDADADGMADDWEIAYLGSTNQPPDLDSDGDGLLNAEEYVAGTDPGSATNTFAVDVSGAGGELIVSFPALEAAGTGYTGQARYFTLQNCTGLGAGAWQGVAGYTNILGEGQTVAYTNAAPSTNAYYRARVWLIGN
ncbi:MAG: lamin tail domain-containing protein [Kiritimatiellae bacterium]|nr:lamin tail domain-containing protein [Kiritimatiellia bacterium]